MKNLRYMFILVSFMFIQNVHANALNHMADAFASIISTVFILMCVFSIAIGMLITVIYFVCDINIEFRRKK